MIANGGACMHSDNRFQLAAQSQTDWGIKAIPPCLESKRSGGISLIKALDVFRV